MIWPKASSSLEVWMLGSGKTCYYQEFGLPSLHCSIIVPSFHCSLLASGWSILHTDVMERSVDFLIFFFFWNHPQRSSSFTWKKRVLSTWRWSFFSKFQESVWNWIRFVPSYRNYTFIRTAIERFLVMLSFEFFNIFTSSYLECILSGPGVNWELAKVSFPCLNNFIKSADQKIWPGLKFNTHPICPNSRCTFLILKISHTI